MAMFCFLKNFYPSFNQQMDVLCCGFFFFFLKVLSLQELCWQAHMLPQMAEVALPFQKSGTEWVDLALSVLIPQVTVDAFS